MTDKPQQESKTIVTLKRAGESVERRGFLDADQAEPFSDPILMAQLARLVEEVGEFSRSCRNDDKPSATELADVVIVCAAISRRMGWDLDEVVSAKCYIDESRGYRHKEPEEVLRAVPADGGTA